jgi:hypothetical protein
MWPSNSGMKPRPSDEDIYKLASKEVIDKLVELREKRRPYEWITCYMFANNYPSPYKRWNVKLVKLLLWSHGFKREIMSKIPDYRHFPFIESLKADGMTLDDIVEHLNSEGRRTVNGYPFTRSLLKQYLRRYKILKLEHGDDVVRFTKPVEEDDEI